MNRLAQRIRHSIRRRELDRAAHLFGALGVEHAAGVFVAPAHDRTVLGKLFIHGSRNDFLILERALALVERRGPVFVDVGANLGTTTLAALRLHGFESAVACEPDPENARYLRATVAVNGLDDRVTVVESALADYAGTGSFVTRPARDGERPSGASGLAPHGESSVPVTTLDRLCEAGVIDPDRVGLLWMDAQGAEGLILAGASRLLERRIPVVAAVRRYRLEKVGGLERLQSIVAASFTSFADLRHGAERRPIAEFDRLVLAAWDATDVLLLP